MQKGNTPLLLACLNGHSDVAQLLIIRGADVDVPDKVSYIPCACDIIYTYIHLVM